MTRNGPKMANSLCCPFHFESEFTSLFLGKIIGTIPDECAADAIAMVKTRNEEIEERKKEKENQKASLYIPSTIGTQIISGTFLFIGSRSKSESSCTFRGKRRRKSKGSRGKPEG